MKVGQNYLCNFNGSHLLKQPLSARQNHHQVLRLFLQLHHSLPPPFLQKTPCWQCRSVEREVCQTFCKQKIREGVLHSCLRACCEVPSGFKTATIIPVRNTNGITELNDYRLVALTSLVMKFFGRLVSSPLWSITGPLIDTMQFAYLANRSVDDASNFGMNYILHHQKTHGLMQKCCSGT